jgi:hypothetical protein
MNTTMAAALLAMLARDHARRFATASLVVGAAAVAAQATFRTFAGSHWATDVPPSICLGIAWVLGAPALLRLRRSVLAALVTAAAIVFAVSARSPDLRVKLPSSLEVHGPVLAEVRLGSPVAGLEGSWSHGWRERQGPLSWAASREVGIPLVTASDVPPSAVVRIAVRPATAPENERVCCRVRASLNGRPWPEVALLRGWRELHLPVAMLGPGAGRAGENRLRLEILDDVRDPARADPGLVAMTYVRLVAE